MIYSLIFFYICERHAIFIHTHFSDKLIFLSALHIFFFHALAKMSCIALVRSVQRFIFVSRDKPAGQRVKILRNLSRNILHDSEKNSWVLWQRHGMAGRSSGFVYVSSQRDGRDRCYQDEKTGSPLDLIGFGISCRWGSSRRRLAINLYPVTRRAVRSQL